VNGATLRVGMHRHEIEAKFDEIVAFAEIERFLDTPVKAPRSVQRHAPGACAWPLPWPRTWSRRSCWWMRCWRWGMRSISRSADHGKIGMYSRPASRQIDVRQNLCEQKERQHAISHRLPTATA